MVLSAEVKLYMVLSAEMKLHGCAIDLHHTSITDVLVLLGYTSDELSKLRSQIAALDVMI
jgi:hypothetical protein